MTPRTRSPLPEPCVRSHDPPHRTTSLADLLRRKKKPPPPCPDQRPGRPHAMKKTQGDLLLPLRDGVRPQWSSIRNPRVQIRSHRSQDPSTAGRRSSTGHHLLAAPCRWRRRGLPPPPHASAGGGLRRRRLTTGALPRGILGDDGGRRGPVGKGKWAVWRGLPGGSGRRRHGRNEIDDIILFSQST